MPYLVLADLVLAAHLAFVGFVVLGGVLAVRRPALAWLHVPCAAWGAFVEFTRVGCPLTPLEISLRQLGGEAGFAGDFIGHYITAVVYPNGLSRADQIGLGVAVLVLNGLLYWRIARVRRGARPAPAEPRPGEH
jgi:hypothetical protein